MMDAGGVVPVPVPTPTRRRRPRRNVGGGAKDDGGIIDPVPTPNPTRRRRPRRRGRGGRGKDDGGSPVSLSLYNPNCLIGCDTTLLGTAVDVENERSPEEMYEAVLRNHLLNQKRLYGLRPTVSQEDNNISISISSRLRGRIKLPVNSGCQFQSGREREKEAARGSVWDRLSPDIPKRGSLRDRIKWPVEAEDLGNEGSSVRRRPLTMRNLLDDAAFGGPNGLAGLKTGKSAEQKDPLHSFDGPKPLSVMLKLKLDISKRRSLRDRIKWPVEAEDLGNEGSSVRRRPLIMRNLLDDAAFGGPKGLAGLKTGKSAEQKDPLHSFEGPKPLSVILKRKREASSQTTYEEAQNNRNKRSLGCSSSRISAVSGTSNAVSVCSPPAKETSSDHVHKDKVISVAGTSGIAVYPPPANEIARNQAHNDEVVSVAGTSGIAVCPPLANEIASNHAHNVKVDCKSPEGVPEKGLADREVMYLSMIRGIRAMSISACEGASPFQGSCAQRQGSIGWIQQCGLFANGQREFKSEDDFLGSGLVVSK